MLFTCSNWQRKPIQFIILNEIITVCHRSKNIPLQLRWVARVIKDTLVNKFKSNSFEMRKLYGKNVMCHVKWVKQKCRKSVSSVALENFLELLPLLSVRLCVQKESVVQSKRTEKTVNISQNEDRKMSQDQKVNIDRNVKAKIHGTGERE